MHGQTHIKFTNEDIATKFEQHMLWCHHIYYTVR